MNVGRAACGAMRRNFAEPERGHMLKSHIGDLITGLTVFGVVAVLGALVAFAIYTGADAGRDKHRIAIEAGCTEVQKQGTLTKMWSCPQG